MEVDLTIESRIFVAPPRAISKGGTKLYLRQDPPANGIEYSPDEPGEFLGYVIAAPSVPRWMSPEFSTALTEHNDVTTPEANLNLYAQDWFEKIAYIPADSPSAAQEAADQVIAMNATFNHALSTGCSLVNARTRIQKIRVNDSGLAGPVDPAPADDPGQTGVISPTVKEEAFYAIVSRHDPKILPLMAELTIAPLGKRNLFVASPLHRQELTLSSLLRTPIVLRSSITQDREKVFNAIKAFQHTP